MPYLKVEFGWPILRCYKVGPSGNRDIDVVDPSLHAENCQYGVKGHVYHGSFAVAVARNNPCALEISARPTGFLGLLFREPRRIKVGLSIRG